MCLIWIALALFSWFRIRALLLDPVAKPVESEHEESPYFSLQTKTKLKELIMNKHFWTK